MVNRKKVKITYADGSFETVWVESLTEIVLNDKMIKLEVLAEQS